VFFGLYLGDSAQEPRWREVLRRHADWLKGALQVEARELPDGRVLCFGWWWDKRSDFAPRYEATSAWLVLPTTPWPHVAVKAGAGAPVADHLRAYVEANISAVAVSLETGEVQVAIPPCTPEQVYFTPAAAQRVIATDLRLMARWAGLQANGAGLYGLIRYGAPPAEITVLNGVERAPNGHLSRFAAQADRPTSEVFFEFSIAPGTGPATKERLRRQLDEELERTPPGTVLYFSGGVDSSLLAARLKALGRMDVPLVNYRFGAGDVEAENAAEMVQQLGLRCEVVDFAPDEVIGVLERAVRDYSFPFVDFSTTVTNLLVHAALPAALRSRCVLDGTGADGAFGMGPKAEAWRRAMLVPGFIRRIGGAFYREFRWWQADTDATWGERYGRIFRRSFQMPLLHAAVTAQNSLEGIAYDIPVEGRVRIEECMTRNLEVFGRGRSPEDQLALLDLVHVCADLFAAKVYDPLRGRDIRPIYPFMQPAMLRLAMSLSWEQKCAGGVRKSILKELLSEHVPAELIYRKKAGFVPPMEKTLRAGPVRVAMNDMLFARDNPLLPLVQGDVLREMLDRAWNGLPVSGDVHRLLWGLAFTSAWWRGLREAVGGDKGS